MPFPQDFQHILMPSPAMAETQDKQLKQGAMSAARGLWLTDKLLIFKPSVFILL